jgi:hypothetical protein
MTISNKSMKGWGPQTYVNCKVHHGLNIDSFGVTFSKLKN